MLHSGYLGDKGVARKTMIYVGLLLICTGCLVIDPPFVDGAAVWSALTLCVIDFGSGLAQVNLKSLMAELN